MATPMATPMKVLVVIDVQNCFMFHKDGMTQGKGGTFLNAGEEASAEIVNELETLVDGKTHVVFSRDFHPVNHISLEGYEGRKIDPPKGVWPKHCRNKRVHCGVRTGSEGSSLDVETPPPNNVVNTTTGEITVVKPGETVNEDQYLPVIGTELSYMFFKSEKLRGPVKELTLNNRIGKNKIGLDDTMNESIPETKETPPDLERTPNYNQLPIDKEKIKYITLTKGERCEKEAYSAFNYHIVYDSSKPSDPVKSIIKPDSAANSTGLWEWILKNRVGNQEITITVCGLVGNVCVMHSLLQGIALWNNVYSKLPENEGVKVKFVYSLKATRFTATLPPHEIRPESFDDRVVGWFNDPDNLPDGMGPISITDPAYSVSHSDKVTSFEVLGYEGTVKKIGTFGFAGVKLLMFSDIEGCQASPAPQSTFLCSKEFYNEIAKKLEADPNLQVAFLGDYFDQGMRVYDSINGMKMLLVRFTKERVHVILGNRDVNKLRFCYELPNRKIVKNSISKMTSKDITKLTHTSKMNTKPDGTQEEVKMCPNFDQGWSAWDPYFYGIYKDEIIQPPNYKVEGRIESGSDVGLVKHILISSMGANKIENGKLTGLYSFMPFDKISSSNDEDAIIYLKAALGIDLMGKPRPDDYLDVLGFFKECKLAHVFNGKVLLAHGGGFDPEAFFDQNYIDSFIPVKTTTYLQTLEEFRKRLSVTETDIPSSLPPGIKVTDSVNLYNNLLHEVIEDIIGNDKGLTNASWKFVLLQALGLKPDREDARYKSLIQSCSQDGCSGPNKPLSSDPKNELTKTTKLAKILNDSGITHVSYGHKPICFPIPVIYRRREVPGVTFISNDTSNGNRKVEEVGNNTAIGTMVIFEPGGGVKTKIEPVELKGREAKVGNYSAMYDPLTYDTTPFYEPDKTGAYVLKYGDGKVVFNKSGYNQLNYIGSSNSGGKRRSRHRKQHKSKRGSKHGGSKKTMHRRRHKHTKRGRKAGRR